MFYGLLSVRGFGLRASDGEMGLCDDFLFDDRDWSVRHMVVVLGTWMKQKKVLISHQAFGQPNKRDAIFEINLTKAQIRLAAPLNENPSLPIAFWIIRPGRNSFSKSSRLIICIYFSPESDYVIEMII